MTMAFNIGDVVEYAEKDYPLLNGYKGVVRVNTGGTYVGVSFEEFDKGHTLDGRLGDCSGWWCLPERLRPLTTTDSDNPLYYFQAHEDLGADSWNILAEKCSSVINFHGGLAWEAQLKDQFKEWEGDFKTATGQPIPGAWRSAKSVIKNAIKEGVEIKDGERVRGKTAVEKDIKAARQRDKEEKDPALVLSSKIDSAAAYAQQHGFNFHDVMEMYFKLK